MRLPTGSSTAVHLNPKQPSSTSHRNQSYLLFSLRRNDFNWWASETELRYERRVTCWWLWAQNLSTKTFLRECLTRSSLPTPTSASALKILPCWNASINNESPWLGASVTLLCCLLRIEALRDQRPACFAGCRREPRSTFRFCCGVGRSQLRGTYNCPLCEITNNNN